jgi:hypothetical protein
MKHKIVQINANHLDDSDAILPENFMLSISDSVFNYDFLFLEKKLFYLFFMLNDKNNNFSHYLNNYNYIRLKRMYVLNLIKYISVHNYVLDMKILASKYVVKYIDYFYKPAIKFIYNFKHNIEHALIIYKNKLCKSYFLKYNFFLTKNILTTNIDIDIDNSIRLTSLYTSNINSILAVASLYYILKTKIKKLRVFKAKQKYVKLLSKINFNRDISTYIASGFLNILLVMNINKIGFKLLQLNYDYFFNKIYNTNTQNTDLVTNLNYTVKKYNNKHTNKIFIIKKKNKFKKSKFNMHKKKRLFNKLIIKKDAKQLAKVKIVSVLVFNYLYNNHIINYKSKFLIYNLSKRNNYYKLKSK